MATRAPPVGVDHLTVVPANLVTVEEEADAPCGADTVARVPYDPVPVDE